MLILLFLLLFCLTALKKRVLHHRWIIHRCPAFSGLVVSPVWFNIVNHALVQACTHNISVLLITYLISAHCCSSIAAQEFFLVVLCLRLLIVVEDMLLWVARVVTKFVFYLAHFILRN